MYILIILIIVYPCFIVFDAFAERGMCETWTNRQDITFCDSEFHAYAIIRQVILMIAYIYIYNFPYFFLFFFFL